MLVFHHAEVVVQVQAESRFFICLWKFVYPRTPLPDDLEIWTFYNFGLQICLCVFPTAIFQIFEVLLSIRLGYYGGFGLIAVCAKLALLAFQALNTDSASLLNSKVSSRSFRLSKVVLVILLLGIMNVLAPLIPHLNLCAA